MLPLLGEGYFLDVPCLPDANIGHPLSIDHAQAVVLAKRIRLMYQIGTIGLLRDQAHHVEKGGFTRTIGANNTHNRAFRNGKTDVFIQ